MIYNLLYFDNFQLQYMGLWQELKKFFYLVMESSGVAQEHQLTLNDFQPTRPAVLSDFLRTQYCSGPLVLASMVATLSGDWRGIQSYTWKY